ncbi:MAG: FecR domain-containing protein [Paludibacteraceae bacterium]|nr:FecR domain-containing protein [Paludibacteraceae bacterium]MBQ8939846.1 FecR domain-containing protein [Paludibacteraceae bacterium]
MEEYYDIAKAYFRGTISAADEKRLSEWLNEDKHALLFRIWEDEWRKQAKAQASEKTKAAWEKLRATGEWQKANASKPVIQPLNSLRWFRYAASVAVFAIIGGLAWWLWPNAQEPFMAQTDVQEQQNFVLSDGSEISLNESSSLACAENFGKKTREVLFEGEASFSVAKDAERPFIIHSGDFSVTVLGTEFTLRAYPTDSIYTLQLTSGKVKVQYLQDSLLAETGDLVQFNTVSKLFRKKLEASNILLSDLVNRLERLYDVHIEVGDTALANETLFISINTDDSFEDVCVALEALLPIVIEQEEDHYRLAAQ